jgi:hypothetical protein
MSKSSDDNDRDTGGTGGGIASAIVQDVELTIEQAEDAAKKAAHAAAVALGLSKDETPAWEPASIISTEAADESASSSTVSEKKP